jgi:hypothetical protein
MKKLGLGFLSLLFVGCSHFKEGPKTVHFSYAPELLERVQTTVSRMPASVESADFNDVSTRRIYFSTLYHQYKTLGKFLNHKSDLKSCPQFHHDKLHTDAGLVPTVSLYTAKTINPEGKAYFPELAFTKNFTLSDYHKTIKSELKVLCEDGASDNFYKFDNLVTHYSHKGSFHRDPKAMGSVLKIPVFANFYLVKMLETPGHFPSTEEKRFIELTKTHWFDSYVTEASRIRNNYIKNKMVSR